MCGSREPRAPNTPAVTLAARLAPLHSCGFELRSSGFSWLGNLAGEVERPRRTYLAVVAILIPLVSTLNLLPFLVSLSLDPHAADYQQPAYFSELAGHLSGTWLKVRARDHTISLYARRTPQLYMRPIALLAWWHPSRARLDFLPFLAAPHHTWI